MAKTVYHAYHRPSINLISTFSCSFCQKMINFEGSYSDFYIFCSKKCLTNFIYSILNQYPAHLLAIIPPLTPKSTILDKTEWYEKRLFIDDKNGGLSLSK